MRAVGVNCMWCVAGCSRDSVCRELAWGVGLSARQGRMLSQQQKHAVQGDSCGRCQA